MSDLQCPVRVFLLRDAQASDALRRELAAAHVAQLYVGTDTSSQHQARSLAEALGTSASTFADDGPRPLEDLADVHRGEAIVVVTPRSVSELIGQPSRRTEPDGRPVLLEGDSDGWRLVADLTTARADP